MTDRYGKNLLGYDFVICVRRYMLAFGYEKGFSNTLFCLADSINLRRTIIRDDSPVPKVPLKTERSHKRR